MWIVSPRWDVVFMFSGLWATALLFAGGLVVPVAAIAGVLFVANRAIGVAHSYSTTYAVMFSPLLRDERRAHPALYYGVPAAILAVSLVLGLAVGHAFGWPEEGWRHPAPWLAYMGLFWVGHFWHFGNQDFGVLSLYRQKAKQFDEGARRFDRMYASALMWIVHPVLYLTALAGSPLTVEVRNLAPVLVDGAAALAPFALGAVVLLWIAALARELRRPDRSVPKALYYTVMLAHQVLLFASLRIGNAYYIVVYLWSHWIIATTLVARIETKAGRPLRHALVMLAIVGAVVVATGPFDALNVFSRDNYQAVLGHIRRSWEVPAGLLLGFFLAEQLVHYWCDRRLFRFKDPGVRKAVGPLL